MSRASIRPLRLVFALIATLLWTCAAVAQDIPGVNFERWTGLAERAETAVDTPDTSDETLDLLRHQIVAFREQFDDARGTNATRIASLRDQLALLEPASDTEPSQQAASVQSTREELETQLALLNAPVLAAEAAFTRADNLVAEIDAILRNRQAEALLEVVASPVNPVNWPIALAALGQATTKLWNTTASEQAETRTAELRRKAPVILFAILAGLVLIFRGRHWSKQIVGQMRKMGARGMGVWGFVVSLLRIILPLIGLTLLVYAVRSTGYLDERGDELLGLIPALGGVMLGFRWVAEQVFARDDDEALLALPAADRTQARFLVSAITLLVIANALVLKVLELDEATTTAITVASFPFTVLLAYALFRIGRLLRHYEGDNADPEAETTRASTLVRIVRGFGLIAIIVAFIAPLLQAAGYYNAASYLLQPTILTLVVLGLVLALHSFAATVYGAITGRGAQAGEDLIPTFIGLLLILASIPVLALIWGARLSDLAEIWAAFRRGFAIGDSRISPTDFLTFALIFTIGYLATRLAQGALKTNVLPKTKIDKGGQNAIVSGLGYVGIFLAALAAITGAGIDLSSLAIVAGALSVGIGFGLQNIVSNFVSGIILLIERPISEGDWIEVSGGQMGYVRDISVRSTRIETFDRTDVIVPNADLVSGTVTNYTRGNTLGRLIVSVGVAYGTDTKMVEGILREIAEDQPMVLATPAPSVLFVNFGASSLDFEIRMFLRDVNWMMSVKNDVNHAIAARFVKEGIEIPYPQQDVWLRNPEALTKPSEKE
ncbi:DUF3772 domain-containing protein [Sulfitobacter sp. HNIBRBA2951]|uniref:DUF3772 domain-containing protein n=1 Tax=Sulfitobacter aquimarinus TaxID=3158557 RepID=UPI0032DFE18D